MVEQIAQVGAVVKSNLWCRLTEREMDKVFVAEKWYREKKGRAELRGKQREKDFQKNESAPAPSWRSISALRWVCSGSVRCHLDASGAVGATGDNHYRYGPCCGGLVVGWPKEPAETGHAPAPALPL